MSKQSIYHLIFLRLWQRLYKIHYRPSVYTTWLSLTNYDGYKIYVKNAIGFKRFSYLCSQNETDSDNSKDINGYLRRVPDGSAKLAEPLWHDCRRDLSASRIVRSDSTTSASSRSHTDRCLTDLPHLQFPSPAHPSYSRSKDGKELHAVWRSCLPAS